MGQAFFLTGRPGVGKTTAIRAVAARLGERAGGFYTQEIRERGERTGFRLFGFGGPLNLVGVLAAVDVVSPHRVGKYGVHLADLERVAVAALRHALYAPGVEVVIIDEIGKMELGSPGFRRALVEALDSPKPVVATVMAAPQPFVDALKARPSVTVVELTPANRASMPTRILEWLGHVPRD